MVHLLRSTIDRLGGRGGRRRALEDTAKLQRGETILITGVTGAVGGAAARIARWRGARVIGTIRKAGEQAAIPDLPVDQDINLGDGPLPESVMSATAGQGVQVVFDVVGGPLFEPCLRCLAHRGRHVAIASTGDGRVGFNLVDFYHREGRIYGVDTLKLDFAASAAVLRGMMPGVEQAGDVGPGCPGLRAYQRRHGPEEVGHRLPFMTRGSTSALPWPASEDSFAENSLDR